MGVFIIHALGTNKCEEGSWKAFKLIVELCNDNKEVCQTAVTLPFTLKSIVRQKKNYGHSNISPCKNIIFKTILYERTKILQDII
jgi:hypothetical protein